MLYFQFCRGQLVTFDVIARLSWIYYNSVVVAVGGIVLVHNVSMWLSGQLGQAKECWNAYRDTFEERLHLVVVQVTIHDHVGHDIGEFGLPCCTSLHGELNPCSSRWVTVIVRDEV